MKVNIEGFEYPLFADIFSNNPERLLNGVSQIHIEQHRQGMQMFGLNWNSLVFGELLFAHFFSGGFVPFAQEKWHDSTAAQDIAFVNQTWYILSENDARNKDIKYKIDFILMPLLCFDDYGNRIGYGKGIYDQICKYLNKSCVKIGLSFFEAHPNTIEVEKHDIPLDFCQTPLKLYKFNF
mgnify:CR=1 FL=1